MGIRGGEVKTYPSVRNVLLLIKLNEKLIEKFFQDGLASFQKRIGSVYQIRWYPPEEVIGIVNEEGGGKGAIEAVRRKLSRDWRSHIFEIQPVGERGIVAILRPVAPPEALAQKLVLLKASVNLGRIAIGIGTLFLTWIFLSGRLGKTPLRLVVGMAILGVVFPALAIFANGAHRYGREAGERMKWRLYREIETKLEGIDLGFEKMNRAIEASVKSGLGNLPTLVDRSLGDPWKGLKVKDFLRMAWVFNASGTSEWSRLMCVGSADQERKLSGLLVKNIERVLQGNPTPAKSGDSVVDYAFFQGQARFALTQIGRIFPLEGFGQDFNLLIERLPRVFGQRSRYFVGIFRSSESLKWDYLSQIRMRKDPELRMGVVGVGQSGPVWSLPSKLLLNTRIQAVCDQAYRYRQVVDGALEQAGRQAFLITAFPGRRLTNKILIGAVPMKPVEELAGRFRMTVVSVMLSLLAMALGTIYILTGFFDVRLESIGRALEQLRTHDFEFELSSGPDEFGAIADGLRKSAHTLSEIVSAVPVQKSLVFDGAHEFGNSRVSGLFLPAGTLGGDFSEVCQVGENRLLMGIGDVIGSGVDSALLGAKVKLGLRLLAERMADPGETLTALNHHLVSIAVSENASSSASLNASSSASLNASSSASGIATRGDSGKMLALTMGLFDQTSMLFTWANAGNCWPLLVREGKTSWMRSSQKPMGISLSQSFTSFKAKLVQGDAVVFFTNGWVTGEASDLGRDAYENFSEMVRACFSEGQDRIAERISERIGADDSSQKKSSRTSDRTLVILQVRPA